MAKMSSGRIRRNGEDKKSKKKEEAVSPRRPDGAVPRRRVDSTLYFIELEENNLPLSHFDKFDLK